MSPNKRAAWCGLVAALALSACGSGTNEAAEEILTSEAVVVETDVGQAALDDDQGQGAEASQPATASTDPPLTLPVPSAGGDRSAPPDDAGDGDGTSSSVATSSSTSSTDPNAATTAAPTTAAPTTAAPTTAAPAANLFPDVSVVNVADRQTVSMAARLGGGDRPILLWFWTPF